MEAMRPLCSPAASQRWLYCLGDPVPTLVTPVGNPAWRMEPMRPQGVIPRLKTDASVGMCLSCGAPSDNACCQPCTEAALRVLAEEFQSFSRWFSRWLNGDFDPPAALTSVGDRLIPVGGEEESSTSSIVREHFSGSISPIVRECFGGSLTEFGRDGAETKWPTRS